MATDKETAQKAHITKTLTAVQREYGYDGCILLCFHHTDEIANMVTQWPIGRVPAWAEVISALCTVQMVTAYHLGKQDALDELKRDMPVFDPLKM